MRHKRLDDKEGRKAEKKKDIVPGEQDVQNAKGATGRGRQKQ